MIVRKAIVGYIGIQLMEICQIALKINLTKIQISLTRQRCQVIDSPKSTHPSQVLTMHLKFNKRTSVIIKIKCRIISNFMLLRNYNNLAAIIVFRNSNLLLSKLKKKLINWKNCKEISLDWILEMGRRVRSSRNRNLLLNIFRGR